MEVVEVVVAAAGAAAARRTCSEVDAAVVDVRAPCEGVGGDREDEDDGEDGERAGAKDEGEGE